MATVSDVYRYTLNLVYDEMLLAYVPMTQPGTGGGGGDVNVLNFPATQPVSIAASVAVTGPLTDAQLRAVAVPVSGTFWQATQPVSGPLTDAELRAVAVPVSGTFWQATQPVSGPLTDAQLRAVAVPVSAAALPLPSGAATEATIAALSAESAAYLTRLDEASATITYVGQSVAGSATSSAVWRIKRLDSTSGLVVLYADGDTNFNNVWDNRASLSYS